MNPEKLSNQDLTRLLLRKLWQIQDASGVSMGRSLRSGLLESILWLIPLPDIPNIDHFSLETLFLEAKKRIKAFHIQNLQMLLFSHLEFIRKSSLAHLFLAKLQEWYIKDEKQVEFPLKEEKRIIDICMILLLPSEDCSRFYFASCEELFSEYRERRYEDNRLRDPLFNP